MTRRLLLIAALFLLVRAATVVAYRDTLYYYGMVAGQYAMAEAAWSGHWLAHDQTLSGAALREARRQGRPIPLEEWQGLPRSGRYTTFPAVDLPGYAYLIAFTSRLFAESLTARYALAAQVLVELLSVLLFVHCVSLVLGARVAFLTGLVYIFGFPFIWPIASQPMRDVFVMGSYTTFIAATFVFLRKRGGAAWIQATLLLAAGSLLLWVRPHGYYLVAVLLPLVALASGRSLKQRAGFAALLVLVPWLLFGYPLRRFNMRHYGVPQTGGVGLALWQQLGVVPNNPYGFKKSDDALVPFVRERYGRDLEYASPEMNRLLTEYSLQVIREHPGYYLKALAFTALEIAWTPLDLVPPFRLVEFSSSGLTLAEFARTHPVSFVYKVFNRVALLSFFHGALILGVFMLRRRWAQRLELAVLLAPFAYTAAVQLGIVFTSRYMTAGAWVLVLPVAWGLNELLESRAQEQRGDGGST
jgi:hypothetical protein